jgi:hypothetical protein
MFFPQLERERLAPFSNRGFGREVATSAVLSKQLDVRVALGLFGN